MVSFTYLETAPGMAQAAQEAGRAETQQTALTNMWERYNAAKAVAQQAFENELARQELDLEKQKTAAYIATAGGGGGGGGGAIVSVDPMDTAGDLIERFRGKYDITESGKKMLDLMSWDTNNLNYAAGVMRQKHPELNDTQIYQYLGGAPVSSIPPSTGAVP